MQTEYKDIYRLASEKNNKEEQIYKDIGSFVFNSLHKNMRRPKALIIKLKGVGTWYLRKKRIEKTLEFYPPEFDKTREDFETDKDFIRYENKEELYNVFKARLEDYDNYLKERDETRKERHKTQVLLTSSKDNI